jgi:hypothetical protein
LGGYSAKEQTPSLGGLARCWWGVETKKEKGERRTDEEQTLKPEIGRVDEID